MGGNQSSSRQLKQRISEHKSTIKRNDRNYPVVAVHFNDFKHDISSFRFQGIEYLYQRNIDEILNRREVYWIYSLQTLFPKGLNDEIPWHVML